MKIINKISIFLSSIGGLFLIFYFISDKKGFRRLKEAFKKAFLMAAMIAGLRFNSPEPIQASSSFSSSNGPVVHEKVVPTQEFNSSENSYQEVIPVKAEGNPYISPTRGSGPTRGPGPSNFPTSSSGGRPSPYRTAPKLKFPRFGVGGHGFGGAPNSGGGGDGSANGEFDDSCPAPKKEQSQKSSTHHHDSTQKSKKKKKKSEDQCSKVNESFKSNSSLKKVKL